MQTITLTLPCRLTDSELAELGLKLAGLNVAWGNTDADRKSSAKDFADRLASIDMEINAASSLIRAGEISRPVECSARWNHPEPGHVTITRGDTGETLIRPMTSEEKQPGLWAPGPHASEPKPKAKAIGARRAIDAYECNGCSIHFSPDEPGAKSRGGILCPKCNAKAGKCEATEALRDLLSSRAHRFDDGAHIIIGSDEKTACGVTAGPDCDAPASACEGCRRAVIAMLRAEAMKDAPDSPLDGDVSPFGTHCNEP